MSDQAQHDNYHFDNVAGDSSIDNDETDNQLPATNYGILEGNDESSRHLISHSAMDDVDLYLNSDHGFFGGEGGSMALTTDYLPGDGDTLEEEDGREDDEGEDGDRLLEEGEREKQAIEMYRNTHPDLEQQQQGGREIDEHEALWKVSTFRPDWGVEKMRDNNPLTYWQSDCPNPRSPHTVDLYFHQATFIKQVSIFIDFFQDESYSPKEISIRGGTCYRDLHEIVKFECDETVGWKNTDLSTLMNEPLRVFHLQIAVLSTHLNGRDVHIRQIKVYSVPLPYLKEKNETDGEFKTRTIFHKGLR